MGFSARELELQANTNVTSYVEARAEAYRKECEASGATFYMLPAIPAEGEYANVYEYERSMAFSVYSDSHKDVHGYRPRGDFSEWTLETLEEETQKLYDYNGLDALDEVVEEEWSKWERMAIEEGYDV